MSKPRSPAPRGRPQTVAPPRGTRIPRPALARSLARLLVFASLALALGRPWLVAWATHQPLDDTGAGLLVTLLPATAEPAERVAPLVAALVLKTFTPGVAATLRLIALLGLAGMAAEALALGVGMALHQRAVRRIPTRYLLLRAPLPATTATSGRAGSAHGDQLFRAIQQALPRGSWWARLNGTAPWVAFTLTGLPDLPIALGVVVADANEQRRNDTAMAIRTIIQGQLPGAQLDQAPDPFLTALRPRTHIAWREYGLRLPAHYPLRFLDDIDGSDLLGPLAAALAPHGTRCTEAQLVLRPAERGALDRGWRGYATALALTLHARNDYALAADAQRIEVKLDSAPFAATIRVSAIADGAQAGAQLNATLDQIGDVLGQYHQRTSHYTQTLVPIGAGQTRGGAPAALPVRFRAPRFAPPAAALLPLRPGRAPTILTAIELAGLWHLPSPALGQLVRWLPCQVLPAPPHAYIAPERADRIMVGMAKRADGTIAPVGPTLRDLRPPLHITAGMGAGKSRALANICRQCIPHGFLLLDGKGDDQAGSLAATVRGFMPLADEQRLIIFDILDTDWPIGLNPLTGIDLTRPGARDQALGQIMAIFARLDPTTWGRAPAMKEFVQMATLLVLEGERTPTLAHVKQCLLDARYRARLLPYCTNPDVMTFWTVTFPAQGEQQRSSLHALLRRFSQLLTTETTRYMVSQPASRLNLLEAIEQGLIVLAPLPHVTLGDLASAIGMLLLQQFVRAAFGRAGTDQTRSTYPLIVDELQVFVGKDGDSTDIQNAITQLRGLGIAGVYAHQTLAQLGALQDEMLTNSGSRLILRTQEPDASTYARLYAASGATAADIAGQDEHEHQYAVLRCDGERTGLFSMLVAPWPDPLDVAVESSSRVDWQTLIPPDSLDAAFDHEVVRIVYGTHPQLAALIQAMAAYDEVLWHAILARWEAIRAYQRQFILAHPGCIPDRLERQRWLSRLLIATPRVLAAVEYARIRRQIEPVVESDGGKSSRGGRGDQRVPRSAAQEARAEIASEVEPIGGLGSVPGAGPAAGERTPPARIPDQHTAADVLRQRSQQSVRRAEVEPGFEDL